MHLLIRAQEKASHDSNPHPGQDQSHSDFLLFKRHAESIQYCIYGCISTRAYTACLVRTQMLCIFSKSHDELPDLTDFSHCADECWVHAGPQLLQIGCGLLSE